MKLNQIDYVRVEPPLHNTYKREKDWTSQLWQATILGDDWR